MTDAEPTVKPSRKESMLARRQGILDSACALIFEHGYDPVSLTDIGAAAGVSGPAIYRHFRSKADILDVLCNQTVDRLIEFVGPRRVDPTAELAALVAGQVTLVVRFPELVRVFSDEERSLPAEPRRIVRRRERDHARRWVDALRLQRPWLAELDAEMLAYATVGMILSAARWPRTLRSSHGFEPKLLAAATRLMDMREPVTPRQP